MRLLFLQISITDATITTTHPRSIMDIRRFIGNNVSLT